MDISTFYSIALSVACGIGVLAIVIFVHELGHFVVAKWCDVEVLTFSIGFGRTLYSKTIGETEYRLALIPLGGYVRMAGQDDADEEAAQDPARGFSAQSLGERIAIVAAGPLVNFVFAFVVLFVLFALLGEPSYSDAPIVGAIREGTPAAAAGLNADERIISIDGVEVNKWPAMVEAIRSSEGREVLLVVEGANGRRDVRLTPALTPTTDHFGEVVGDSHYRIGIEPSRARTPVSLGRAAASAGEFTWRFSFMIFEMMGRLFVGRVPASELGGPIMIAQQAGRLAHEGIAEFLNFLALISVNLGVINLLPIPVLDGGHLAFFAAEGLRGRPLSVRFREMAQQVGLVLILALFVFVFYNDIARLVGAWLA